MNGVGVKACTVPRLPARAAAVLEQLAVSGANFIAFLIFARQLAPAQFGEFGFAYALVLFVQGFQRALVTIPMIPFSAARSSDGSRLGLAMADAFRGDGGRDGGAAAGP